MKIVFEGLESSIAVSPESVSVLEIENRNLFTRVVRSLCSMDGAEAIEPYSVWDDEGAELAPSGSLIVVANPIDLPWQHKDLGGRLHTVVEGLMMEDEEERAEIERLGALLAASIGRIVHQIHGEYSFGIEWNIKQHLKSFSFSLERDLAEPYLDSLISFLDFCVDMGLKRALVFVNLKLFLGEEALKKLYERVFFLGLRVLLVEAILDETFYEHENKTTVDLRFIET